MTLNVGDRVPDLSLTLSGGAAKRLSDFSGRWLVLYFYPKDSTPSCTVEGLDFNQLLPDFDRHDATVIGVSRDSIKSHQNFCAKQGYRFELASDADEVLCRGFDVLREKNMYGRKVFGIERSTFLIAPDGTVAASWRGVRVPGHAQAVLDALEALSPAA